MKVRERDPNDLERVKAFLEEQGSRRVARLGKLVDPLEHPALLADDGHRIVGVLTYVINGGECEVLTLHAKKQWHGVGSALLSAVEHCARHEGCGRMWLITTNDNVDALRFYQRRGYELVALHRGAVEDSRARLKPEIPHVGDHGIALRDELELEKLV